MATTGWLDARWQWVAGTKLVPQSAERDAQQVRYFVVGAIGPVAFGHARHSVFLFGVMEGTMEPETSREIHAKGGRLLSAFERYRERIARPESLPQFCHSANEIQADAS